jgi:hypothetical protein
MEHPSNFKCLVNSGRQNKLWKKLFDYGRKIGVGVSKLGNQQERHPGY